MVIPSRPALRRQSGQPGLAGIGKPYTALHNKVKRYFAVQKSPKIPADWLNNL